MTGYDTLTVAVVQLYLARTLEVVIKHESIALVPVPLAELPVPRARQSVEQLRVVEGDQSVQILVAQCALEAVVFAPLHQHSTLQVRSCDSNIIKTMQSLHNTLEKSKG